ncbi:MAG: bifunctional hydroxymethylpyrimidine kinase/phosphomethylpyrimidine kinase, partial [Rikenellaceae bacterium]|nr:bifunctional hydroxymethylpyrimidine kinase/phosphomethylpyrimidine kinase [Rikenellaceae bacterium]
SASMAAYLAQGYPLHEAAGLAIEYLHRAIEAGAKYECGHGHGPVHHYHRFWE